jgi:hypothetical protein
MLAMGTAVAVVLEWVVIITSAPVISAEADTLPFAATISDITDISPSVAATFTITAFIIIAVVHGCDIARSSRVAGIGGADTGRAATGTTASIDDADRTYAFVRRIIDALRLQVFPGLFPVSVSARSYRSGEVETVVTSR